MAITDLLSKGSKLRLTRRGNGSHADAGASPDAVRPPSADLQLPPAAADRPIPADFNLPDAFRAGAASAPARPPDAAPVASEAVASETVAGPDAAVEGRTNHAAFPPAIHLFGEGGLFGGDDDDEPADDFFRGTASAPMSSVPPPPEVLYAERPAAPPRRLGGRAPRASRVRRAAARRPLPSGAVLALGALGLLCLTLLATLVMAASGASLPASLSAPAEEATAPTPGAEVATAPVAPEAGGASVPAGRLAALDAAANLPLPGELAAFLRAAEESFGDASAQLDPALRPYAYRLASRFEWNPDTFRVQVAAPDAALAQSRVEVLTQVFSDAVASGRLVLVPTTGPSALSLVVA